MPTISRVCSSLYKSGKPFECAMYMYCTERTMKPEGPKFILDVDLKILFFSSIYFLKNSNTYTIVPFNNLLLTNPHTKRL